MVNTLSKRVGGLWTSWTLLTLMGLIAGPSSLEAAEGGIRGWVMGQTAEGEHVGTIAGAKVEFLDANGKPAYSATSDEAGYYSVGPLPAGDFNYALTYKVTAEGYRSEDDGRGFEVAADGEVHVMDFVLTQGKDVPKESGILNGHVWRTVGETKEPVTDARVAVKLEGGGPMILDVDEEGAYEVELPTGSYRLSAMVEERPAMVHPEVKEIAANQTVTVDFLIGDTEMPELESTVEVYALVSVQLADSDKAGGKTPAIEFRSAEGEQTYPAKVRPMNADELGSLGLSSQSSGLFEWYNAEAVNPLPLGRYIVTAQLEGYGSGKSDVKEVSKTQSTTFDVALRPLKAQEEINTTTGEIVMKKNPPGVRGWVMGQTEEGEHIGVIANAKVEFLKGGAVVASTQSSAEGYYSIEALAADDYTYRVTAVDYAPEDAGRGFSLPDDGEVHVHDFVLTKGDGAPMPMAELNGHVWLIEEGEKMPVEDAVVAVRAAGASGIMMIETDEAGAYEVMIPAGSYAASATVTGFAPAVHPSVITLAGGDETSVDFTVGKSERMDLKKTVEVYALVSVQLAESDEPGGQTPSVVFVDDTTGEEFSTNVTALKGEALTQMGLSASSTLTGYFDWFEAKANEPLPVGMYHASASLNGYHPDTSESKEVSGDFSTFYDLALRPIGRAKPIPDDMGGAPSLRGWVMGQTEEGKHLGPIGNATVDLLIGGKVMASAITSATGYYGMPELTPGSYTYRVTAPDYAPEDAGRGFVLPNDHLVHVQDFVLTKGSEKPVPLPKPGMLEGHVWWTMAGEPEKEPIQGATVAVRMSNGGSMRMAMTDAEGYYKFVLPAGSWQASAMVEGFGSHVHPELVPIVSGEAGNLDFIFNDETMVPLPCDTELYALIAVEGAVGPPPLVEFFQQISEDEEIVVEAKLESLGPDPTQSPRLQELGFEFDYVPEGEWRWFLGTPPEPVGVGKWAAEGMVEGWFSDMSDAAFVEEGLPVFLQLMLEMVVPELVVEVEGKDGKPIPGVSVKIMNKTAGQSLSEGLSLTTDAQGETVSELAGGMVTYNVMVSGDGYEPQGREVVITEEQTVERFRLFKEGEMRTADFPGLVVKRIEGKSGKPEDVVRVPVAEAKVRVEPMAYQEVPQNYERASHTGAKGEFLYKELLEGTYYVSVQAPCCESWSGPVEVTFGMEEAVIELDQCNQILEGGLRLVLTEGWGGSAVQKNAAERGSNTARKQAPDDCRVDYALALAAMSAEDLMAARNHAAAAIQKTPDELFWDRACEVRIWTHMFLGDISQAATEIRSLVQKHYVSRNPTPEAEETAFVCGQSIGFMMGPAKEESASVNPEALDQAVESALKEPLKAAYVRGRDLTLNDFLDIRNEEQTLASEMLNEAASEKEAQDAQRRARMAQIEPTLNALGPEIEILEQRIQQETINCQGQLQTLMVQQQQFNAQMQQYTPSLNEQSQCLAQDRQEYASMMAVDPAGAAGILEEMRMHEQQILVLNRQIQSIQMQAQQLGTTIATMQAECRRKVDTMQAEATRKRQDYDRMYKEWQDLDVLCRNPIDPRRLESPELMELAQEKKSFDAYCGFPLEERKQEMLALLPCGLEKGTLPPPLPESTLFDEDVPPVNAADLMERPMTGLPNTQTMIPNNPSVPQLAPLNTTPQGLGPATGMTPGAYTPAPTGGSMSSDENEVFEIINQLREQSGLPKFTHDPKLTQCSRDHSQDMQKFSFFDHESPVPGKKTPWDRAAKFGADANAENIAQNGRGPTAVIGSWMDSPGHRANIMNPSYTRMGVGNVGEYWTQMFGE